MVARRSIMTQFATMVAFALVLATCIVSVSIGTAPAARASTGLPAAPNAQVYTVAVGDDGTQYIGGAFTLMGGASGPGVAVDPTNGVGDASFPTVTGTGQVTVRTAISDGSGGVFIGGVFNEVGGVPRSSLAHINADGNVDAGWKADVSGSVEALALSGGTLYIGGDFTSVNSASRTDLAAVNASTAELSSWAPQVSGTYGGSVGTLAASASTLFVGGSFSLLGNSTRNNLGSFALSNSDPVLTTWDPNVSSIVESIALTDSRLYIVGMFTSVGGQTRNRIAAFATADGSLAL